MLESKLYDDTEIQNILHYVSEREDIPVKWLFFNMGTDKHVGTRIPARLINPKEKGDYINEKAFDVNEKIYYYAGYDRVHRLSKIKNFYWDTKENIINYLKSQCEFKEGTTQEEIDDNIKMMFNCYTTVADEHEQSKF